MSHLTLCAPLSPCSKLPTSGERIHVCTSLFEVVSPGAQDRYVQVSWAFYQLRQMIEYKAKKAGHSVIVVDPRYTSQTCPKCGTVRKANRDKRLHEYHCSNCGYRSNDDRVAAMNIQRLGYQSLVESQSDKV